VNAISAEEGASCEHLGESAFSQAWAEGQAMSFEQAVAYALETTRPDGTAEAHDTVEPGAPPKDPQLARSRALLQDHLRVRNRLRASEPIATNWWEMTSARKPGMSHGERMRGKRRRLSRPAERLVFAPFHPPALSGTV
jgi:hypothetical protein